MHRKADSGVDRYIAIRFVKYFLGINFRSGAELGGGGGGACTVHALLAGFGVLVGDVALLHPSRLLPFLLYVSFAPSLPPSCCWGRILGMGLA